jgi:poly(ADP-ribose) glycohydrolase ARH3
MAATTLRERFRGCLLGLAIGDALGGRFEAQSAAAIRKRFPTPEALFASPTEELWYTDDTQMAIGVAETLAARGEIIEETLCQAFVANYTPSRGYGQGARAVLEAMEEGRDYRAVAERYHPGGSFGNGAAMRVAPVGLFFRDDPERLKEQARLSALPTHRHPLGIEGAQLLALGVAFASHLVQVEQSIFLDIILGACVSEEFKQKLLRAHEVRTAKDLAALGNRRFPGRPEMQSSEGRAGSSIGSFLPGSGSRATGAGSNATIQADRRPPDVSRRCCRPRRCTGRRCCPGSCC